MDSRLKDKVAIVTGGARGIGAAFCEGLAEAGAKVVVSDVLDGGPLAERLGERQRPAIYVRADVTSKTSVENLVADTVREFGTVDILVNNAGLFADLAMKPFMDIDEDEWDRVMKVNVRGSFQCAKASAAHAVDLSRWQALQALGIFRLSVVLGVTKWKVWAATFTSAMVCSIFGMWHATHWLPGLPGA